MSPPVTAPEKISLPSLSSVPCSPLHPPRAPSLIPRSCETMSSNNVQLNLRVKAIFPLRCAHALSLGYQCFLFHLRAENNQKATSVSHMVFTSIIGNTIETKNKLELWIKQSLKLIQTGNLENQISQITLWRHKITYMYIYIKGVMIHFNNNWIQWSNYLTFVIYI